MRASPIISTLIAALGLCAAGVASAQTPAPASGAPLVRDEPVLDRNTQRVQHIRIEDAGSRVDEVRSGGETQSITVQPKAAVPPYDVEPADASGAQRRDVGPGSAGRRTWKVLSF